MTLQPPGNEGLLVVDQLVTDTVRERYLVVTRHNATTGAIEVPPAFTVWSGTPPPTTSGIGGGSRLPPPPGDEWGGDEGDDDSADEGTELTGDEVDAGGQAFQFAEVSLAHEMPESSSGTVRAESCEMKDAPLFVEVSLVDEAPESDNETLRLGKYAMTDLQITPLPTEEPTGDE